MYVTARTQVRPKDLPDYFLSHGRHWLTTAEIADAIGGSLLDARQTANRWQTKGLAFSPTRGAYVLIPPEFRTWRAVPASHFVDDMMRHLGHAYYVGYLSAAEIHDAAHQRPQVFQVVTGYILAMLAEFHREAVKWAGVQAGKKTLDDELGAQV